MPGGMVCICWSRDIRLRKGVGKKTAWAHNLITEPDHGIERNGVGAQKRIRERKTKNLVEMCAKKLTL